MIICSCKVLNDAMVDDAIANGAKTIAEVYAYNGITKQEMRDGCCQTCWPYMAEKKLGYTPKRKGGAKQRRKSRRSDVLTIKPPE